MMQTSERVATRAAEEPLRRRSMGTDGVALLPWPGSNGAEAPFGAIVKGDAQSKVNPFRFVGAFGVRWEPQVGLSHMGARWYDPTIGRFLSRDPVASGNLYTYVQNNPMRFVDPTGEFLLPIFPGLEMIAPPSPPRNLECVEREIRKAEARWGRIIQGVNDKWFHCVVQCEVSRTCGRAVAEFANIGHELDQLTKDLKAGQIRKIIGGRSGAEIADIIAGSTGIGCDASRSCETCCECGGYSQPRSR